MEKTQPDGTPFQLLLRRVIFGTDTFAGRAFDIALIISIVASVSLLLLDTINSIHQQYGEVLSILEWSFTILFTIEYGLRIYSSANRWSYFRSFYGVVDLLSILPSYLMLIFPGASFTLVIRVLRLFRVFRVLKLIRYLSEGNLLLRAMLQSSRKIFVFFFSVSLIILVLGAIMYEVEGPENGFTSIPTSIYWTVVTITTVGYGDITPHTYLGKTIAAFTMLLGYSIIAIPTGILTAEISQEIGKHRDLRSCSNCSTTGHESKAHYCYHCGAELQEI
ncbi:ion transporter [Parashewanella curva]|uniref:Ion transporter n=1 Tax=Parashewanella curva TaxID=2338552 RepID=A0A3L8Q2B3_9GAMM|nr:ion transporter [Parashewanella curva]RLV61018.1 ion transporter [Parashewanella curva]